jgi:hypothetical protein
MSLRCDVCIEDLISVAATRSLSFITVKDRGGLVYPSKAMVAICKAGENTLRGLLHATGLSSDIYQRAICRTLNNLLTIAVQRQFKCAIHCSELIREISHRYIQLRIHYETVKASKAPVLRTKLNRLVIFSHV